MLAYIPYMDPMGYRMFLFGCSTGISSFRDWTLASQTQQEYQWLPTQNTRRIPRWIYVKNCQNISSASTPCIYAFTIIPLMLKPPFLVKLAVVDLSRPPCGQGLWWSLSEELPGRSGEVEIWQESKSAVEHIYIYYILYILYIYYIYIIYIMYIYILYIWRLGL